MPICHPTSPHPKSAFAALRSGYVRTIPDGKRKDDNSAYVTSYGFVTIPSLSDAVLDFTGGVLWAAFIMSCAWGALA